MTNPLDMVVRSELHLSSFHKYHLDGIGLVWNSLESTEERAPARTLE